MQAVYELLIGLDVRDENIHAESFGPASLDHIGNDGSSNAEQEIDVVNEAVVGFDRAGFEHAWTTDDGALLDFAKAHGLTPNHGCRSGACGSCAVRGLSGKTRYKSAPKIETGDGEVLICCAVPAKSDEPLLLDL